MVRKYAVLALSMALACTLLAGCAPVGLPITDDEPAVTLPARRGFDIWLPSGTPRWNIRLPPRSICPATTAWV